MAGIKPPLSGFTTPEYITVQNSYAEINLAIAAISNEFVSQAYACGLIPSRNLSIPCLDVVLDEVSRDPVNYYSLQHIIATLNVGSRFNKGVGKMEATFRAEMRKYIPASSESPETEQDCPKVFISFSRRKVYSDSPDAYTEAKELYAKLNEKDCKPWMDEELLEYGEVLTEGIFRAIKDCDFIIPIVTGGYATSLWCLRELYYAALHQPKKAIIPMLLEDEDIINNQKAGKWLMGMETVQKYFKAAEKDALVESLKTKDHVAVRYQLERRLVFSTSMAGRIIKLPSSGTTTPEYKAILTSYEEINSAIAAIPNEFVSRAHSYGLIPSRSLSKPSLDVVLDEVSRDPINYYCLQHIIATMNVDSRFDKVVGKMEATFREMMKYIPASSEDPETEQDCPKVFISFSTRKVYRDSPDAHTVAKELYAKLNEEDCKPWMDKGGLAYGKVLTEEIIRAIKHCNFIILIMTGGYATSLWCLRELYHAALHQPKKAIIPMLLEDEDVISCQKAGMWLMRMGTVQKYFKAAEKDALVESLKTKIVNVDKDLILKPEHLSSLKQLLWPSKAQYKHIYAALGYEPSDLQDEMEVLFKKLIAEITTHGRTTKQQLIAALRSQSVGHGPLAKILEEDGSIKDEMLNDSHMMKLSELLLPAAAQYSDLASELDVNLDKMEIKAFDIMLHKVVDKKQVTQRQLAYALQNPQVKHGQLADKLLEYDFERISTRSKDEQIEQEVSKDEAPDDAPGELKVSHSLPTTAKLSWSPLPEEKRNSVITGYKVQIVGPDSLREIQVKDTSVEVPSLKPSTSYTFKVSAMTKAGTGPVGSIVSKTPKQVLDEQASVIGIPALDDDMKCPVCRDFLLDPCTLSCGHNLCQLCLARMWERDQKICPKCRKTWDEFPPVNCEYRDVIEHVYGHKVEEKRKQFTQEDKQLIKQATSTTQQQPYASAISRQSLQVEDQKQLNTIFGSIYMPDGLEGLESYHFGEKESYISLSTLPPSWRLDDGSHLPEKKSFLSASYDDKSRTFRGEVEWSPVTCNGEARWIYRMVFSRDLMAIQDGDCICYDAEGKEKRFVRYGKEIIYRKLTGWCNSKVQSHKKGPLMYVHLYPPFCLHFLIIMKCELIERPST